MKDSSSDICNYLYTLAREQNGRNVWLDLNGVSVLLIQNLEDATHVLSQNHHNYHKNMAWFRQALGASRFSENESAWKLRSELTQPYFAHFDRNRACDLACKYANQTLAQLAQAGASGLTLSDTALREMSTRLLIEYFFNVSLEQTGINIDNLARLMEYGSEYAFVPAGKTGAMYRERLAQLPELRRQILQDFAPFRQGKIPSNPILDGMLAADQRGDIVLEQELLTLFAAGAETSAATVGWACYLLAKYPDIQARLHRESAAYAHSTDWQQLSELAGISALISETLRLYPPTPIIARLAIEADVIGNEKIPAGQNVLISFIGIQHDERLHPDPWDIHMGDVRHPPSVRKGSGTNTAFSLGPRVCGGKHFALVELTGFLHTFITRGLFTLTSDAPPVFFWKSQMLRHGGHPVKVTLREDVPA